MKKSLFGQNIIPSCGYCENSAFEDGVAFCKKGKQIKLDKCRCFKYDPLLRVPKTYITDHHYTAEDFRI